MIWTLVGRIICTVYFELNEMLIKRCVNWHRTIAYVWVLWDWKKFQKTALVLQGNCIDAKVFVWGKNPCYLMRYAYSEL